jgi:hypothetical protein
MNHNTTTNFKKCRTSKHFTVITQSWEKQTEHCDEVADIPISYSGVVQLLPGLELPILRFLVSFLSHSR